MAKYENYDSIKCFLFVFVLLLPLVFFSELIHPSLGDGAFYAAVAKDFPEVIANPGISSYTITRVVPSVIVNVVLRIFGVDRSGENILCAFAVLNALCISGVAYYLSRTAKSWKIPVRGVYLILLLSYCFLKHAFYYPNLSDCFAFLLGAASLYYYVSAAYYRLTLVSILGVLAWPTFVITSFLMLVLPRVSFNTDFKEKTITVSGLKILTAVSLLVLVGLTFSDEMVQRLFWRAKWFGITNELLGVSILVCTIYLGLASYHLLSRIDWRNLATDGKRLFRLSHALLFLPVLAVFLIVKSQGNDSGVGISAEFTFMTFLHHTGLFSLTHPGVFIVAHVAYFGLLWPLLFLPGVSRPTPVLYMF